jgi:hypothetical protein
MCWIEGAYNRDRKLNLLMAISADPQLNMEWHDIWPQGEGGTTVFRYYVFLERIIAWLAEHWPGRSFCFTADNLNVHHDENIIDLITSMVIDICSEHLIGQLMDQWSTYSTHFMFICLFIMER